MEIKGISFSTDPRVRFKTGQAVFKEGEPGDTMFVLLSGIVEVSIGPRSLGTFEPVEIVGELAVIEPGPRSATIIAKTDCEMVVINPRRFKSLALQHPEFCFQVMKLLVERLRWMTETARTPEVSTTASNDSNLSAKAQMEIRSLKSTIATQAEQIRELQELIEYLGQQQAGKGAN